ncbi:MAG TPA: hypothetical protein EYH09_01620 [Candidatus Nanopusillus sp.]|nr:hypothetical protein [Candidatus Nanopusillus sp.]
MIKLTLFGKKKEEKPEFSVENELLPELQRLKEEVEKGGTLDFGQLPQNTVPQTAPLPLKQNTRVQHTPQGFQPQPTIQAPTQNMYTPPQPTNMSVIPPGEQEQRKIALPSTQNIEKRLYEERPELYIKIDDYKRVLELLDRLKVRLKDLESILEELKMIKDKEGEKLEEMREELENTKENINSVLDLLKQP